MKIDNTAPEFFQDEPLPKATSLTGWAALVHHLDVAAPVRKLSCISEKHVRGNKRREGSWVVFDKRYRPDDTLDGHLSFALRHEEMDLLVLKRVLDAVPDEAILEIVRATPTGAISRRVWFFFETLTGRRAVRLIREWGRKKPVSGAGRTG